MATRKLAGIGTRSVPERQTWIKTGFKAAFASGVAVLVVQALALTLWPELASFRPLDSYPRTVLFTFVPAFAATAVFAWLVKHQDPIKRFLFISAVVLLLSFIPDYALPLENKSLLGSSVAALMHLTAGITTVWTILFSSKSRTDV